MDLSGGAGSAACSNPTSTAQQQSSMHAPLRGTLPAAQSSISRSAGLQTMQRSAVTMRFGKRQSTCRLTADTACMVTRRRACVCNCSTCGRFARGNRQRCGSGPLARRYAKRGESSLVGSVRFAKELSLAPFAAARPTFQNRFGQSVDRQARLAKRHTIRCRIGGRSTWSLLIFRFGNKPAVALGELCQFVTVPHNLELPSSPKCLRA